MKRVALICAITTVAVAAGFMAGMNSASGAGTRTLSFDAATFVQIADTTHAAAPPCANEPTEDPADGEFHGAMLQRQGGMLLSIQLAKGSQVTKLRYTIVDQDQDADSFVYLLRKSLAAGLKKEFGYSVMAMTHSTGNVLEVTRQFTDSTIEHATADPTVYAYYLEIVNCAITLEPIGVQVTVTT
jgi:hypothetical protein